MSLTNDQILTKLRSIFEDSHEVPTDHIVDSFNGYLNDEISEDVFQARKDQIKQLLKKLAFFDKQDKVWIPRD